MSSPGDTLATWMEARDTVKPSSWPTADPYSQLLGLPSHHTLVMGRKWPSHLYLLYMCTGTYIMCTRTHRYSDKNCFCFDSYYKWRLACRCYFDKFRSSLKDDPPGWSDEPGFWFRSLAWTVVNSPRNHMGCPGDISQILLPQTTQPCLDFTSNFQSRNSV